MIHRFAAVASGAALRLHFSRDTSVFSAIEMPHDVALYKVNVDIDIDN